MTNEKNKAQLTHIVKRWAVDLVGLRHVSDAEVESLAEMLAPLLVTKVKEEREAVWQPIETADPEIPALLFTPARRLWNDPTDKPIDIRVAKPRDWTWATHWQPLPDTAALEAAIGKGEG